MQPPVNLFIMEKWKITPLTLAQAQLWLLRIAVRKLRIQRHRPIFSIFPNPTNSILNITNPENKGFSYRIITSSGIMIGSGKTVENSVNVSSLIPGIYILELNDGNQIFTKTFIKN